MKKFERRTIYNARIVMLLIGSFSLLSLLLWRIQSVSVQDQAEFHQLLERAGGGRQAQNHSWKAKQERSGIQKDLYFMKEGHPLHVKILAETAELMLDQQGRKTGLVEQFQQMRCLMQEEVFYQLKDSPKTLVKKNGKFFLKNHDPKQAASWLDELPPDAKPMQVLRYLEADQAFYRHHEDLLEADTVKVYRYIIPGHDLNGSFSQFSPLFKGNAARIECSLKGAEPHFKATNLKMTFFQGGNLK